MHTWLGRVHLVGSNSMACSNPLTILLEKEANTMRGLVTENKQSWEEALSANYPALFISHAEARDAPD